MWDVRPPQQGSEVSAGAVVPLKPSIAGSGISPREKGGDRPLHKLSQAWPGCVRSNTFPVTLQVLTELKSDNQRLKDENGALIRVISKLSK